MRRLLTALGVLALALFWFGSNPAGAAPADVSDGGGSTLSIDLGAGEALTIASNGATYTLVTNFTFADSGVTDPTDFSGFGTDTLTVTASGISRYDSITITDSGAGASVTFGNSGNNPFDEGFDIVLDEAGGAVDIDNEVQAEDLSVAAEVINLGADVTTFFDQLYDSPVVLGADVVVSSDSGEVLFDDTVDGNFDLTINADVAAELDGNVGQTTNLDAVTVNTDGVIRLDGLRFTALGDVEFNGPITATGGIVIFNNAGPGSTTFASTIDGGDWIVAEPRVLTFGGAIGATAPIVNLQLSSPGSTVLVNGGEITTLNLLRLRGNVTFDSPTDTTTLTGPTQALLGFNASNTVRSAADATESLIINSSGPTQFAGVIGDNNQRFANITTDAAGTTEFSGGPVDLSGVLKINDPATLTTDTVISAGGDVIFPNTIDGAFKLTLNSPGTATFSEDIGATTSLNGFVSDAAGTISFDTLGLFSTGDVVVNDPATGNGLVRISTNNQTSTSTFTSTIDGGNWAFFDPVAITLEGELGGTTPLSGFQILTRNQTVNLRGGDITVRDFALVRGNLVFDSPDDRTTITAGGEVILGTAPVNVIQGAADGVEEVLVSTPGTVSIAAAIGGSERLEWLRVQNSSATTLSGRDIAVANFVDFNSPVILAADTTISSQGSATLDHVDGAFDLQMNLGTNAALDGSIGATTALTGLEITAASASIDGAVDVDGDIGLIVDDLTILDTVAGTGKLTIEPASLSTSIGLGGTMNGTLTLTDAELALLADGFTNITFGSDSTPFVYLETVTLTDPVTLVTVNGVIDESDAGTDLDAPGILVETGTVRPGGDGAVGAFDAAGDLNLSDESAYVVDIVDPAVTPTNDVISVTGTVTLDGTGPALHAAGDLAGHAGGAPLTIIDNDGVDAVVGTFAGLAEGDSVTVDGFSVTISYTGGDGNDVALTISLPTCDGLVATIVGSGVINGTGGDDVIVGSDLADTITGFGGDDVICAEGGNDIIIDFSGDDRLFGGEGNDRISSGIGDDELYGGPGEDVLRGQDGDDTIDGGDDDDDLVGGNDNDVLIGGFGDDRFRGGPGIDTADYSAATGAVRVWINDTADDGTGFEADNVTNSMETVIGSDFDDILVGTVVDDILIGGDGNDRLVGRAGNDELDGGAGDDLLLGGGDDDDLDGGADTDRCLGAAGTNTFADCESDDTTPADPGVLEGQPTDCFGITPTITGAGVINGTAGDDVILGSSGNDVITGFGGNDIICGGEGNDVLIGFSGVDVLLGGDGNDRLLGGTDNDTLLGGSGHDVLKGEDGNDSLFGQAGNDDHVGGSGNDYMTGEEGDDRFRGGPDHDIVDYDLASGAVLSFRGSGADDGAGFEADDVQDSVEEMRGSQFDDFLIGSNVDDLIEGGFGDDRIVGRNGSDDLDGEDDDDFILGGADDDELDGNLGTDRCIGAAGDDTTVACETDQP